MQICIKPTGQLNVQHMRVLITHVKRPAGDSIQTHHIKLTLETLSPHRVYRLSQFNFGIISTSHIRICMCLSH